MVNTFGAGRHFSVAGGLQAAGFRLAGGGIGCPAGPVGCRRERPGRQRSVRMPPSAGPSDAKPPPESAAGERRAALGRDGRRKALDPPAGAARTGAAPGSNRPRRGGRGAASGPLTGMKCALGRTGLVGAAEVQPRQGPRGRALRRGEGAPTGAPDPPAGNTACA